jgi:hypothetical protein
MSYLLFLLACETPPATGVLDGLAFDCTAGCWRDAELEVPTEYWDTWLDGSACGDASITVNYAGTCFATRDLCESDWADDPNLRDPAECCDGAVSTDEMGVAPACVDVTG